MFDELVNRHSMVKAFQRERRLVTSGVDIFRPSNPQRPLTLLRHGNDWRGLTWFDKSEKVVWLCACSWHRSGEPGDAFRIFDSLHHSEQVWPTDKDYEALTNDRGQQFAVFVLLDAPRVLAEARADPEIEKQILVGLQPVSIVVQRVETLEETFVAVSGRKLMPQHFQLLLVSLFPESPLSDWQLVDHLPTRALDRTAAEFCMSIVHG